MKPCKHRKRKSDLPCPQCRVETYNEWDFFSTHEPPQDGHHFEEYSDDGDECYGIDPVNRI